MPFFPIMHFVPFFPVPFFPVPFFPVPFFQATVQWAWEESNTYPELELLSPNTTYPLLQQSKGWQIRMEQL